jgi:hypothetical protein
VSDDVLGLVLGKLGGVRQHGGYWMACCPAHEDGTASLSIARGTEQPVVLKCHAGCEAAAVLDAIGLTLAEVSQPREQPDTAIAYSYTDEHGELLYEVLRKPGKKFVQRCPDGRGGWRWNLDGTRRVLYRLPRVAEAVKRGETVWIAEGEKDVHALERAGVTATCNPGGAGKWRHEYAAALAGASVMVVADRDEAGRKHAADIAASLEGTALVVTVVEAARGKDAADHLAARRGLDDFRPVRWQALTTKDEERRPSGPAVPSADPAMYTGILGEIVAAAAPTTEADPVGIYASLLAGTGVIMNATPYVRVGNTHHPLLIWPLLLGRTGSGRKGEATSTAEIFLRSAAPEAQDFMVSGLSSGEGLIERIRDPDDDPEGKFRQPGGTDDKRLIVLETEFASVLARSKREGSTLAAVQRQAWEGRALSVLNRKQLRASASHIAIIGHITPQEFKLRLAEADMTGGTYNRYLPLFVERSQRLPIPEGVSAGVVASLGDRLRSAIRNAARSGQLQLGQEATQLWSDELYDELTAADDDDLAEAQFTRRAAPYCLRIAGLFAVLDGRRLISKGDLVASAALIRYSIASAKYILDRQLRDPRLDRIRRAVDGAGQAGLSRTDISALFSRNLPKADLDQLLSELVSHDEYEESLIHGRGRPAQTYRRVVSSSFVPKDTQP